MTITQIELYNIIKNKPGDKEAQTLVDYITSEVESEVSSKVENFATKRMFTS